MTAVRKIDVQAQSEAPTEIWYTRCPVPTASGLAQHFRWLHGEFERNGLTLESIRGAADASVRDSHFNHTHPNSFREGGNVPAIWARANGQDTVVVGITWVDEEQVILVRPDSDLHEIADLKGRRIGLPKHATKHVDFQRAQDLHGFTTALKLAGLSVNDVTFVDIADQEFSLQERTPLVGERPNALYHSFLAGEVDAIYAKGAVSASLIAKHGLRVLLDINAHPDPLVRVNTGTPRPVTVNRDLAVNHPEIVARYLAVLIQAGNWARRHPDEVVKAVAAETGSSEDAVRRGYGPKLHEHFDVQLSPLYVDGLERQKEFLHGAGFLAADFNYRAWIVREPLDLARSWVAAGELPVEERAPA